MFYWSSVEIVWMGFGRGFKIKLTRKKIRPPKKGPYFL
jgi:hypothetical protein